MNDKERNQIKAIAKAYSDAEYDQYLSDIGWQDWMQEYCKSDSELIESEVYTINSILENIWNQVHDELEVLKLTEVQE